MQVTPQYLVECQQTLDCKELMTNRFVVIVVILTLLTQLTGCAVTKTRRLDPTEVKEPGKEKIVGITTVEGEDIRFDPPGASVKNDTIYASVDGAPYEISLARVQRFWVERKERSRARTIGLVAAVAAIGVILVAAVIVATKESCPFIYSWDGTQYIFDAEPYGGAITRGLERDDYSELEHLRAEKGLYRLMITNEVLETQFTNLMELQVVDHPAGTRVVADEWGNFSTLAAPQRLTSARDHTGRDLLPWLEATDRLIWESEAVADVNGNVRHEIVMSFPKPKDATSAKLVAKVATGLWGSYMIKAMLELRGRNLEAWYASIDHNQTGANALHAWTLREELYALKLYVEEPTGWELRGILPGGGPFIAEDRVVLLDVSRVPGRQLRIRVRPPAGFWALNSFVVDYSSDKALSVENVPPLEALDEGGRDVLSELLAADDSYYAMPVTGNYAYVSFSAPERRPGMKRTVFLHSRGYYRLHLTGRGEPNIAMLQEIRDVPDAAARLAAVRFVEWQRAKRGAGR